MNKAEKNGFKFNKKFQRIMVFVLAFFVLFSSFGSTLISSAIPRELDEIDVVYEKFELVDKKDEKPLEGLFQYWTGFFLKIKWDASAYGDNLKEGDHFTVNIPDEIKLKTAQEFDLTFEGKVIGRAVITPGSEGGGTIKVTFNKNVEHVDKIKGDLKIDAMFNVKKYVKQENGDYKISFEFDGKHYEYDIEGVKLNQNEIFNKWSNTQPSGFDRVEWVLRINVKKATFSNTVITDELSVKTGELPDEIKYIPSSFKLRNVRYGINGAVEEIYKIFYYSEISSYITFDEKQQKFTFRLGDFLKSKGYNDISEKQWMLIYDSTYIEGMKLRNKANFTATETTVILESSFFNEHASGGISGEINNRIRIKKVDSENESVFLKGAVFKIKNISTGEIFTDTTDDDGIAEFEHLKPGQYTLEEVTPPPGGYMKDDTVYTLNVVNGELTYKKIKNTKNPKISKTVTKTWNDSDNQDGKRPDKIKVTLYANGEKVTEVEVTKANGWKHTFADLPKYKDGQEINYTVKETPVEGYQTAVNGMDITNSRTPDKISKTVTKTWNDSDNQDGKRPDKIKVTLYANGEKVTEVEVTKANGWKHTFADLPKYKDGQEINYTVKETPVEGYQTAVNGMDITNSRTPDKISKTVTKTWNDSDNQDGKRPDKIKVTLYANGEKVTEVEVTKANGWKHTFADLPKYKDGQEINYTVKETPVEGYQTAVNGMDITNSRTPDKISKTVTKTWNDSDNQDGKRPDKIKVTLYANGEKVTEVEVTKANGWKHTFADLPKYKDGQEINYTVKETPVEGYQTAVNGMDITNSRTPDKISKTVTKTWNDSDNQDGKRPDKIKVTLYANGEKVTEVEVTKANGWKHTFADLPKYKDGQEINYTVKETPVEGYQTAVNGMDITNSRTPDKISKTVTKTWNDSDNQDGKRPDKIKVTLYANGEKVTEVEVTKANGWKHTFADLPKYKDGQEINYTVKETPVEGYQTAVNGMDITNSRTPDKISKTVTKTWNDSDNQDGKRPDKIKVTLYANGEKVTEVEVTKANGWKHTFADLPKYKDGQEINYTVKETPVEGYQTAVNGMDITNSRTPDKISKTVTKTWNDSDNQDGKRPDKIKVTLYANGEKVTEVEVTKANGWKHTFADLPKYKDGQEINYTVKETPVEGYQTAVNGMDITNSRTPDKISKTVTKTWNDSDNQDGKRPDKIKVTLYANGEKVTEVEVTKANGWKHTFADLPKYKDGQEINYTVKETPVEGYQTAVNGMDITNSRTPDKISKTVTKTWNDSDNQDGKRPDKIKVTLYANGEKVTEVEVTKANGWKHTFADLPKYKDGQEINYTVKETPVEGYQTAVNGMDITNSRTPDKISKTVTKTWNDSDNQDGKRPDKIKVTLYANGEKVTEVEVTKANGWKHTFADLPKYKDGQEINYTVKETPVEGYQTAVNGMDITNSRTPTKTNKNNTGKNNTVNTPVIPKTGNYNNGRSDIIMGESAMLLSAGLMVLVLAQRRKKEEAKD